MVTLILFHKFHETKQSDDPILTYGLKQLRENTLIVNRIKYTVCMSLEQLKIALLESAYNSC